MACALLVALQFFFPSDMTLAKSGDHRHNLAHRVVRTLDCQRAIGYNSLRY
jgi:hypothetical protein